jgi:hypothetical protein
MELATGDDDANPKRQRKIEMHLPRGRFGLV